MLGDFRQTLMNVQREKVLEIITQSASHTLGGWGVILPPAQAFSSYTKHRPVYPRAMKKVYNYLNHFSVTFIVVWFSIIDIFLEFESIRLSNRWI